MENMEIVFEKWHGTENDVVLIPDFNDTLELTEVMVRNICNRRRGIGADGVIRMVRGGDKADFLMDYRNRDGSIAEMCGNGIRCMAASLRDRKMLEFKDISIDTRAGVKDINLLEDGRVRVNMGPPIFNPRDIPMLYSGKNAIGIELDLGSGRLLHAAALSMGNPHLVLLVRDINDIDIEKLGPRIENHELFPEKTNFEVAEVNSPDHITMKVWERGVGITRSCGTGACAAAVAARLMLGTNKLVTESVPGGDLEIEWSGSMDNPRSVYLTGPAEHSFSGTFDLSRYYKN